MDAVELVGTLVVLATGALVGTDLWRTLRSTQEVPRLGPLPRGGHAWRSQTATELVRHLPTLLTLVVMALLPWLLVERTGTPLWQPLVFGLLLVLMGAVQLLPKRYALTRTHLFADGWRLPWERLARPRRTRGGRLLLDRRPWGPFATLPLGGGQEDLALALRWAEAALAGEEAWTELCAELELVEEE